MKIEGRVFDTGSLDNEAYVIVQPLEELDLGETLNSRAGLYSKSERDRAETLNRGRASMKFE